MENHAETVTIPKVEYEKFLSENADLRSHVTELTAKVEWLMEQFRLAQHRRFSASSEKSVQDGHEQLNLFNEPEIASDILVPEPELVEIEKHYRKRRNMVNGDTASPIVLYEYQPDRKAEHPKFFLKNFSGYLHLFDAYKFGELSIIYLTHCVIANKIK